MSSFRERNDRKSRSEQGNAKGRESRGEEARTRSAPRDGRGFKPRREDASNWLWGRHAVEAALKNPQRTGDMRLLATADRARELQPILTKHRPGVRIETTDGQDIARLLPQGAVHQGMALRAQPLEDVGVEDIAEPAEGLILMLDQVTDPQNVGAILRSAAAFGARGVIVQDRNAPALTGALAKAAAGAVDMIPCARVTNLSRALERLSEMGWRSVGLAGEAEQDLEAALDSRPTVLVMGSEGEGLRRLVAEHCDALGRIPMPGGFESLNVSNAAAIALYAASRATRRG